MINKIVILLFFPLLISAQPAAFISANERICDNAGYAIVKIDFQGNAPFTFIYAINGIEQTSITTHDKSYCISTKIDGIYTLKSFRDAFHQGDMNGSGEVTVVSVTHSLTSGDLHTAGGVTFRDPLLTSSNLDGTSNPIVAAKLQLNGHDRFSRQSGAYFNFVQPFQHFSNTPSNGVNVYSFALNPEDHQPSGTCNMSRIDNATLSVNYADDTDGNLCIYGLAYNVLRIMSGMGGLAYSN